MTNNEALIIAANYDAILEMTGIDFGYSLELLEESKKAKPVQDSLNNIKELFEKKVKPLHEKKAGLTEGSDELLAIEAEIKIEAESAQKAWDKIAEAEFNNSFKPIELSKVPTDTEHLDKRLNKDGVSIVRSGLLFLSRKELVKQ